MTEQSGRRDRDPELLSRVRHLFEVERLSQRQIAESLSIARKTVARLLGPAENIPKRPQPTLLAPYARLIDEWYERHPRLKASQIFQRLQSHGYPGGYTMVKEATRTFRIKRRRAFHELVFLPGEESQVDWMQSTQPFGVVYGFVFLMAWSRYLFLRFFPRCSMEFFLQGHLDAFAEIGGLARRHRYDNLKSVVTSRHPELRFNPQFLDFARHYRFSIHACTPGRPNEKGRVERAVRDINDFIRGETFADAEDLQRKATLWRRERNAREHRSTRRAPAQMLLEENLQPLPQLAYSAYRIVAADVSTTGFVSFENNRYSVPLAAGTCQIQVYPTRLQILLPGGKIVMHERRFGRNHKVEHPLHRERLLNITPHFKLQRIHQLMKNMDPSLARFLANTNTAPEEAALVLFRLLKKNSRPLLLAAVREAVGAGIYKLEYLLDLLREDHGILVVRPQDPAVAQITYAQRPLEDYDELI
jgi:transposase